MLKAYCEGKRPKREIGLSVTRALDGHCFIHAVYMDNGERPLGGWLLTVKNGRVVERDFGVSGEVREALGPHLFGDAHSLTNEGEAAVLVALATKEC